MRSAGLLVTAALVASTAVACSSSRPSAAPTVSTSPSAAPTTPSGGAAAPASCPPSYRPLDPQRPQVTLAFTIGTDHRTVTGHERVVFTPDQPVTELVYRLWPNGRDHRLGGSLTVTRSAVAGRVVTPQLTSAGGRPGTQGTLMSLPLGKTVAAGTPIVSELDFTLRLPPTFIDRLGSDGKTAWWGTGTPLLAWVRGTGWVRTPGASTLAEDAVSEAAQTNLTVTAPTTDTVFANGAPGLIVKASATQRRWYFTSPAARDVVVAVGRLTTLESTVATGPDKVPVTIGVSPGADGGSGQVVLAAVRRAFPLLVKRLGPYPFPQLSIAVLNGLGPVGIEYPGMVLLGSAGGGDQSIVTHEMAHMWFYALVGNDQELHPWLDEAFATAIEQIVDAQLFGETLASTTPETSQVMADPRAVDSPTSAFERDAAGYDDIVYFKGAAALIAARAAAGTAKFDAALRCYVNAHAWTVVSPQDVATAFAGLPAAVRVLRKAGAIR